MITRHIADLLYHHECVIVPGLGGFIKAGNPAWILYSTHEFYPPSGSVAFNAGLSANDGLLANHITSTENTSYREALYEIKVWVDTSLTRLKNDEKVTLEGIGELFLNNSGKIEFTPSKLINFNADSFGLPVFRARPVSSVQEIIPEVQPAVRSNNRSKIRHLVPETLKWAAVLAPFIAFILWGSIKGNLIDNYIHNYTGMYSWVRSTPGKTAPVTVASVPAAVKEKPARVIESPAGIMADKNITFNPGLISYSELAKENIFFINNDITPGPEADPKEIISSVPKTDRSTNQNLKVTTGSASKTEVSPKANSTPSTELKTNSSRSENTGSKVRTRIPTYPWAKTTSKTNTAAGINTKTEPTEIAKANPEGRDAVTNSKSPALAGNKTKIESLAVSKNNAVAAVMPSSGNKGFHIIGGAFREHNNALKLIETLKAQGYSPAIIDTTPGGLYVVSIMGFINRNEAEIKLKEIRKDGYSTSWIMKKKKS
jgi:cell division septation protein DedD